MRKYFKTLSELKLKFIPKAWKREAMAHKTPFKRFSLKIEILTLFKDFYFFYLNLTIWISCLKTWVGSVSWLDAYLLAFFNFKK